jgi:uncharacterized repeat protein (TIGR03803 family)
VQSPTLISATVPIIRDAEEQHEIPGQTKKENRTMTYERKQIYCVLGLLLAGALASPAQEGLASPDAVKFKTLVNFDGTNGSYPGGNVNTALVQGTDGNLYGTTSSGGAHGGGTVFQMTSSGSLTVLYDFCALPNCADGSSPSGLVLGPDGGLYGTTNFGGANTGSPCYGAGTFFKMEATTVKTLYSFCDPAINYTDGGFPNGMVLGRDGNFYGTTGGGGNALSGTVFKITPEGMLSTLWTFCTSTCTDGENPNATVIQGLDGNFYGTAQEGGTYGWGTIFKITPKGALTTLYSFCAQSGCPDGATPIVPLVQAANGDFYGTMRGGGTTNTGIVFKISPAGAFETVYSFCAQPNCADGNFPWSGLIQATDGNLYGTTFLGGTNDNCPGGPVCGTIFKITTAGVLTSLHSFDGTDGDQPIENGLFQATSGKLYGQAYSGGTSSACSGGCGTNYGLSVGLKPFVQTLPTSGKAGETIQILGTDLSGATSVAFNGTMATFSVTSGTLISATVPAGATTGFVTVTTPSSTLRSNTKFRVR